MAKRSINYDKAKAGSSRGISARQWNGFLGMHKDYYNGNANNGQLPPILQNSVIANAVLKDGSDSIGAYQPVRITKIVNVSNISFQAPSYEVEPVDADGGDRHGNYAFTLSEGMSSEGGRIVISGMALVKVTRDQCVEGSEVGANYLGTPFDGYDGKYESDYYMVPDGTLSDDTNTVVSPVGHFKILSWYVPDDVKKQADNSDSPVFLAIDMSRRFTTASVEIFATISGYSGNFDDQTYNQGYAYLERPLEGTPATIADVNPRVVNNNSEPNTPSIKNGEANYFRCLVTNPHLYDIAQGTHVISYSESYNKLIVTGDPMHNDGRINAWMYSFDPDELCSRGRSSGFYMANGYGDYEDDNTDSCPYPTYLYTSEDRFAEGTVMLAADYMTKGGSSPTLSFRNQGVPHQLADDLAPAIVLMMDANHEYATYCSEKCPEEGVLMSADYGEYRIIDKKPLHNNSASGTYPQWNRCLGFLKNESQMSGVVEIDTINATAHTGTKYNVAPLVTPEGLKEITTASVKTNVIGLTRANHVDKMSQPQYQGSLTLVCKQSMAKTGDITIDTTTLYKYNCPTTLRVWGVDSAGAETQIDSSVWDTNISALHDASAGNFETVYNVNFFWEEKYKFIYFDIETDTTGFSDITGTINLHRRTNFGGDSTYGNGQITQPADLTLPAWPTYPNGDTESAGIYYLYTR